MLPAEARAKVSFRLVGRQDPARIAQSFRAFVKARLPADVKVEFLGHGGSPAIGLPARGEALRRARRALEAEWGKPAAVIGSGGSIPIVGAFKRELGMDSLMVGFGLDDDAHPFAEREIRAPLLSQGRALLGAHPRPRSSHEPPGVGCGAAILRGRRLLLVKRLKAPEAGCWNLPGGKVDFGERAAEAVAREVAEELGVAIELTRSLGFVEMIGDDQHWVSPIYRRRSTRGEPFNAEPDQARSDPAGPISTRRPRRWRWRRATAIAQLRPAAASVPPCGEGSGWG